MNDQSPIVIRLDAEMQAIVPKYLANRAGDCDSIREQAASGGFADARRLGHNMKGTGGGYGFEEISRLGAAIEAAAAAGETGGLLTLADELGQYLARVKPVYE
jgi:HPt (histidine-containing phosphotransfer) domain-containing protein